MMKNVTPGYGSGMTGLPRNGGVRVRHEEQVHNWRHQKADVEDVTEVERHGDGLHTQRSATPELSARNHAMVSGREPGMTQDTKRLEPKWLRRTLIVFRHQH